AANGAAKPKAAAPVIQQRAGFGHGTARAPRAENLAPPKPKPKAKPKPAPVDNGAGRDGQQRRPTRSSLQGERAPGSAGGVRRVVIDSQAARRTGGPGGPGGPGGGPGGAPQRRPPRRGGRRRRGTYTEPVPQDVSTLQADII